VLNVIDIPRRVVQYPIVGRGRVPAVVLVGLLLVLAGCGRTPIRAHIPTPEASAPPIAEVPVVVVTPPSGPILPPPPAPPAPPPPAPPAPPGPSPLVITGVPVHVGEATIAYSPVVLTASGGTPPYSWSISVGVLPAGLSLSSGGTISGTPTAAAGYSFTVQVTDVASKAAGAATSITILPYIAVSGHCTSVCYVEQGCAAGTACPLNGYTSLSGGVTPYQFTVTAGALPPGTSLNGTFLAGTFTTISSAGPFSFTVMVTDALGASGKVTSNISVFSHITLTGGGSYTAPVKQPYSHSFPYRSVDSGINLTTKGTLPPGLTASLVQTASAVIVSGTPTTPGTYGFTMTLTDTSPCGPGYNCSSTIQVTITVA